MSESNDRQEWSAAFQRATWGCAPAIGRALGLSSRAVQQWGQADSDKRSPGERLEILMRVASDHRKPHDALAPLHLLAGRLGYRLVPDQPADAEPPSLATVAEHASAAMVEAGEAVQTVLKALQDDLISNDEMDAIERECDEAIEALIRLKQAARRER
ncbi:MAG: phage regulatory CII family protein [Myxococcota bacterium]